MRSVLPRIALIFLVVGVGGCARKADTAPPLVTPSATVTPADAAIGSPIELKLRFVVAPGARFDQDYMLFVHFMDTDRELMWTDDHQPPVPTSQWKADSTIEYSRDVFIPKFPYVGDTRVEVGLVSPKTGERVAMAGDNKGQRSIQVASFNLRLQSDNLFVVFKDGWQDTETSSEGVGVEWQWSKKEGTLAFRNPGRDAVFYLQADQPARVGPQQVEVRIGSAVVDRFTLEPGGRELRKTPIAKAQFGDGETVEIVVAVDKTFVPALLPALGSTDSRELGIRVFRAFVQPL